MCRKYNGYNSRINSESPYSMSITNSDALFLLYM